MLSLPFRIQHLPNKDDWADGSSEQVVEGLCSLLLNLEQDAVRL